MSQVWLYKLKPKGPFHFGERGVGIEATEEIFHSDSLFSALAIGIHMWSGKDRLESLLARFLRPEGPPFRITSLFPYAGAVLLFPRPMLRIGAPDDKAKIVKDIRFVSEDIFSAILRGEPVGAHLNDALLLHGGSVWVTTQDRAGLPRPEKRGSPVLWGRGQVPRVAVDRLTGASQVYRAGRVTFAPGCGLWFLLETADDESRPLVDGALSYLSEAGLGGERTAGHGQFVVQSCEPFASPWATQGNAFVTLSLYHPTLADLEASVLGQPAAYDLVQRRGWVGSLERGGQRRKSLACLAEGSVFPAVGKAHYGDLADVTPDPPGPHRVYRYGFAFPVLATVEAPL